MHSGRRVYACRMSNQSYLFLANAVLVVHAGVVLFIVGGLVLILLGGSLRWRWVHNTWFRVLHLAAIAYVVVESWLGIACPLTDLEQWLRETAGQPVHEGDFIAFWLGKLLFYQAAPWVFVAAYSMFALIVACSWVIVRPRPLKRCNRID
ncbi:MAG: putative threonine efflux protein [Massilia sp.]|nr:putative threonine efflux protein [Massilia sp.]MDB5948569.1 putative threonine efflux protein [Massilia sp.]